MRTKSYGESARLTIVDKFGIWLSEKMVRKYFNALGKPDNAFLDLGCGYRGRLLREFSGRVQTAVGVDVKVCGEIKSLANVKIYEESIEEALLKLGSSTFDLVTMINVLEHLEEPLEALTGCHRLLKKEGLLLVNVPTWRGKFFLELSAFTFKLSPAEEIEEHRMYYDKKDLWPLLVKAGFKPGRIEMHYHKFGLNLFAACRK
jgi:SAM-dependent methyltransferase